MPSAKRLGNWITNTHGFLQSMLTNGRMMSSSAQLCKIASNHDSDSNSDVVAYRFRRKDYFMGKWIKRSTLYPSWFLRFYRPERIQYGTRAVHEYPTVDGRIGELSGHLLHYSFNKGLEDWLLKHVRYSRLEAIEILKSRTDKNSRLDLRGLLAFHDPIRRRQALKQLSLHVPFRPLLRFLHLYAVRGGFLDGIAGYRYCRMLAMYESMIQFHVKDLSSRATPAGVEVQISSIDGRNGLPPHQSPVGLASARAEAMLIKPATRP